jgi:hypothetical protein
MIVLRARVVVMTDDECQYGSSTEYLDPNSRFGGEQCREGLICEHSYHLPRVDMLGFVSRNEA